MELNDQYGLPDLRHLLSGRPPFPAYQSHFSTATQYDPHLLLNGGGDIDNIISTPARPPPPPPPPPPPIISGFELEGNGRWPRQETLTLLEIRSHLDSKFKEANQKGPLWEEVSRIMADEHGYQRTGKKCREKFENLYKYYKKTKEGKAGRQDGKHYRFFRQLEALYGDINNPISVQQPQHHFGGCFQDHKGSESLSMSNSSSFDSSSSSDDNDDDKKKMAVKGKGKRSWKSKIKDFVDSQMKKLMETQEAWLEKMMKTLEQKEHERMSREEDWRKQEEARSDRERKFWANERAWFEARDAAFMEALKKITEKELKTASSSEKLMGNDGSETLESTVNSADKWPESEISSLIHLRTNLESKFQQSGYSKEALWIEISSKMGCLGYDRGPRSCEEKWDDINKYIRRSNECTKKRKENSNSVTCPHFQYLEPTYSHGGGFYGHGINDAIAPSPSNLNVATPVSDSCFRFLMGAEGENLWENYGVKINRGDNNQ